MFDNIFRIVGENWIVALVLIAFFLHFVFAFCLSAYSVWKRLDLAIRHLKDIKSTSLPGAFTDLDLLKQNVFASGQLSHLWSEYRETLHPQKSINGSGQEVIVRWRATVMAESFFTEQALVDTPLKTEYFKHLPGMLTGLGIIGTFSGLIKGLSHFKISSDANLVRNGLQNLIHSVGDAFMVSATAIGLAIIFTFVEKIIVSILYNKVENLYQLIDTFFDAGAGEEYLSRLVQASETSATQALQLKDALVSDLKEILTSIAAQQVQDSQQSNQIMSQSLAQAIADSMREPMDRITQVVQNVGSNQGDAVNKLLTDVLASFSSQMHDMFGGQLNGMNDLLGQTSLTLQNTSARFEQLVENMQNASAGAADKMAEQMREVLTSLEAKQEAMAQQMQSFVEQMRHASRDTQNETAQRMQAMLSELGEKMSLMVSQLDSQSKRSAGSHEQQLIQLSESMGGFLSDMRMLVADSQSQTSDKMRESLGHLGDQMQQMLSRLDEQSKTSSNAQTENLMKVTEKFESFLLSAEASVQASNQSTAQASQKSIEELGQKVHATMMSLQEIANQSEAASTARNRENAEQTAKVLDTLVSQVDNLGRRVADAAEATRTSATLIATSSKDAIERMNTGAELLSSASSELAESEKRVATTMNTIAQSSQALQTSSSTLSSATVGVQTSLNDYKLMTTTFATLVTELKFTIENAKKDAFLTTELVSKLQKASESLSTAQVEADHYLHSVTDVLGKAHAEFGDHVNATLRKANAQFHEELSGAVGYLSTGVRDLGEALETVLDRN